MAERMELATLAGGCFWCLEAAFQELEGVSSVQSGYAGGSVAQPTYQQVCSGSTRHAEVVQVAYDPDVIAYEDLLRVFFTIHDPTTLDRQGGDVGTQYRSAVFYHSDEQRAAAAGVMREIAAAKLYAAPLVTRLESLEKFWPAESYHDDYYRRNPGNRYCQVVIDPKLAKFRKQYADRLRARVQDG
ncbi:MAG: peptide-methionine (S)-S-oxide reductase [Gemmatimonadetes bacterium]|nr:peptide-methionine (S)-S-oxide reductase [Gemmatimonadota bacterium]